MFMKKFKNLSEIEKRTPEKAASNLRVKRWVYKQTSQGRQYRALIELPAKLMKGHFTTDEQGHFIMLRDINPSYIQEAHLDEDFDLFSPEIEIIKKEYLDQLEGFMDFTPKQNGIALEVNDRLSPADLGDKKLVKYLESVRAKHKKQQISSRLELIDKEEQNKYFSKNSEKETDRTYNLLDCQPKEEQTNFVGYGFQVSKKYYSQILNNYLQKKYSDEVQKRMTVKLTWNERFEIMKQAQMCDLKDQARNSTQQQTQHKSNQDYDLSFGDQQNFSFTNT